MTDPHRSVSPAELKNMLHDGAEIALLDVREAGQFGESHLLFATPLPYSRLELDAFRLVPRNSSGSNPSDSNDIEKNSWVSVYARDLRCGVHWGIRTVTARR